MPSLDSVLRTCSPDEVRVTTHALVLQLARTGDASTLPDEMKTALALAMIEAGLTPDSTRAEWDEAIKAYVAARPVRDDMLLALKDSFHIKRAASRGKRR